MIAFLGMYDMPAVHSANDRFWSLIRNRLGYGPELLCRDRNPWEIWQSPDLLLAQTCGMPYRTRLHSLVTLVGTPDYGVAGCPPGHYHSVLVARADASGSSEHDFAGGRFAYNEAQSQSGWAAPMTHFNALRISFAAHVETGAHAASARAVAEGRADITALDAVTWDLMQKHDPVAGQLKIIAMTTPTPGLPFVTARGRDAGAIANAVRAAIGDLTARDRASLRLRGLVDIPQSDYLAIPDPPRP